MRGCDMVVLVLETNSHDITWTESVCHHFPAKHRTLIFAIIMVILTLRAARSMSSRLRVGAFSDIVGET